MTFSCCCWYVVKRNEQLIVHQLTSRRLLDGPSLCTCLMPWEKGVFYPMVDLKLNQFCVIRNENNPAKDRTCHGPGLIRLQDPFELVENEGGAWGKTARDCPVLDQDDYITVCKINGTKVNIRGPTVFKPEIGETYSQPMNTIQVPVNSYIIINDSNNPSRPVHHQKGPYKFFPEPFQSLTPYSPTQKYWPCIEITSFIAIHIQRANGDIELMDTPQFYMPEVGEKELRKITKEILLITDFCIIKSPDGHIDVKNGKYSSDRAFFLKPFYEFVSFECDKRKTILSTLPTFFSHKFAVRTFDNVILDLDLRVSYQIQDVDIFSANPINEFYVYIRNHVQNELLDRFSQMQLRDFMTRFSKEAQESIGPISEYFQKFGIAILDVQILNYTCTLAETQKLLDQDIYTNVTKQNELRSKQNDILISEQSNELMKRSKDLEVQMSLKDNEVNLQKKQLENSIRLKEMEIEILEETKKKELLEVRRGNQLMEAEFEGRAKGHELKEFLNEVDPTLSIQQKMQIYLKSLELEQAKMLYSKVDSIQMYPPSADIKLFQFNEHEAVKLPPPKPEKRNSNVSENRGF